MAVLSFLKIQPELYVVFMIFFAIIFRCARWLRVSKNRQNETRDKQDEMIKSFFWQFSILLYY